MSQTIRENYFQIINEINSAIDSCGRKREDVKLIAVSKFFPAEDIVECSELGHVDFGENKAQEMKDKSEKLKEIKINWHFIGRIQTNKVKYIVPVAEYIHSVHRMEELSEINSRAEKIGKVQKVLIEVNVSREESKAGIDEHNIFKFIESSRELKNIQICGLMTMAPLTDDMEEIRGYFRKVREIRDELNKTYPYIKELSMGMSNDYKVAIEEGATFIRIGTAIFGGRNYTK